MASRNRGFSLKLTGFEQYKVALDWTRFDRVLSKHVDRATQDNADYILKQIIAEIKRGVPPRNAPLTTMIKHANRPLVDTGQMLKAIRIARPTKRTATIGFTSKSHVSDVATAVHEGASVLVTEKMRSLFFELWQASRYAQGERGTMPHLTGRAAELFARFQDWKPLSPDTRAIHIPARPFIRRVMENTRHQKRVMKRWEDAVNAAFREVARK